MSFSLKDIMNLIVPPRIALCTIEGDTAANLALGARQPQFKQVADATAIFTDDGSHTARVQCVVTTPTGKIDPNALVEVIVDAVTEAIDEVTINDSLGTIVGHTLTLLTSTKGVVYVRPSAAGIVDLDVVLHGAENGVKITLKNRGYVSTTGVLNIA
jgi:hypothetical protein